MINKTYSDMPQEDLPIDQRVQSLHQFLATRYQTPIDKQKEYDRYDLTLSGAHMDDLESIKADTFKITHFKVNPRATGKPEDKGKESYNFYVGGTEFNMTGEMADDFEAYHKELLEKKDNLKS